MNLYITGAGVSLESGIPTFRGADGFWTIGSNNYTPQEMATRKMYMENPAQFLLWYFNRFVKYRNSKPNKVHYYLKDKNLITQNIDGLDAKAGNKNYISIHGNLHKVTKFHEQGSTVSLIDAPWQTIENEYIEKSNKNKLKKLLLNTFKISTKSQKPELMISLKPFVLLFDEYYTNIYRINEAEIMMQKAKKFIFIGTSFNVNITSIALNYALKNNAYIDIVDPNPIDLRIPNVSYYKMSALAYINKNS